MGRELVDPMASVRAYLAAEKSSNTRRAYASDFADFSDWCGRVSEQALPASPVVTARYLAQLADGGLKASTITRRCAAIRYAHKAAGHEPPTGSEGVKAVMRGIRRKLGTKVTRKAPATAPTLATLLAVLPSKIVGLRDRAILLVGFAAALRRSELAALTVDDVDRRRNGAIFHLRRSKTDQEGKGRQIPVPNGKALRPIEALDAWLEAAKISSGPLFREVDRHGNVGTAALSDRSIARVVKRAARAAGLDETIFSGHSMRAGFVTTSLDEGVDPFKVMKITGHVDPKTLAIYDRRESDIENHAGKGFL